MKNNKANCVDCGETHGVSEVEVMVMEHTGFGAICPKCIQELEEAVEEMRFIESQEVIQTPEKLYANVVLTYKTATLPGTEHEEVQNHMEIYGDQDEACSKVELYQVYDIADLVMYDFKIDGVIVD